MLITAAHVLAGPDRHPIADGAVLVRDGAIAGIGPREEVQRHAHSDEPRLAFPAYTVMPGLIDAHVHLCFDAGPEPVATLEEQDDEALFTEMQARAEQLLCTGVTTARDLGDRNGLAVRLAQSVADGLSVGPRVVSATTPVTPPGGHCWFLGGEVSGVDEVRRLVQRNVAAGANVIKVMETGGGLTKGAPRAGRPSSPGPSWTRSSTRLTAPDCRSPRTPTASTASPPRSRQASTRSSTAPG